MNQSIMCRMRYARIAGQQVVGTHFHREWVSATACEEHAVAGKNTFIQTNQ